MVCIMDIKALQAYITVAETLHFGEASKKLNLSQPSLSVKIKRLEDELGFSLFERSPAGVKLTEQGQIFRSNAENLLNDWQDVKNAAAGLKSGRVNVLRVGLTDISLFSSVPQLINTWSRNNPGVKIELTTGVSNEIEKHVDTMRVDIGFYHPPAEYTHLSSEELFGTGNVVVLPDTHPLADREVLNLGELANEKFIFVKRSVGPYVYDRTIAGCVAYGFSPEIVHEVGNSIDLIGHVAIGIGVGLAIAPMISMAVPGVKYVPLLPSTPLQFGLCWRPGFYDTIAHEFINIAKE